ncbi:MAG: thioredoxin [Ignavibacteriae bacterium]|nr:MAG: thioredoxin [Ignavibacteriota bacterium]
MNLKSRIIFISIIAFLVIFNGCSKVSSNKKDENPSPEHLTAQTFKEKVFNYEKNKEWKFEGDKPCIVDFYADWCAPCKKVAPILEEISKEYAGKINIYKVDVDSEKELANAFGIQSIPSILFIPSSGQPQMTAGAMPKEGFVKAINDVLLK